MTRRDLLHLEMIEIGIEIEIETVMKIVTGTVPAASLTIAVSEKLVKVAKQEILANLAIGTLLVIADEAETNFRHLANLVTLIVNLAKAVVNLEMQAEMLYHPEIQAETLYHLEIQAEMLYHLEIQVEMFHLREIQVETLYQLAKFAKFVNLAKLRAEIQAGIDPKPATLEKIEIVELKVVKLAKVEIKLARAEIQLAKVEIQLAKVEIEIVDRIAGGKAPRANGMRALRTNGGE